jgi:hypothetical protein
MSRQMGFLCPGRQHPLAHAVKSRVIVDTVNPREAIGFLCRGLGSGVWGRFRGVGGVLRLR